VIGQRFLLVSRSRRLIPSLFVRMNFGNLSVKRGFSYSFLFRLLLRGLCLGNLRLALGFGLSGELFRRWPCRTGCEDHANYYEWNNFFHGVRLIISLRAFAMRVVACGCRRGLAGKLSDKARGVCVWFG